MFAEACYLIRISRPRKRAVFKPFIEQQESGTFPKQCFDPIAAPSAEEKQCILFKRIQMVMAFDDLRKSIDTQAQIRVATDYDEFLDTVCIIKQRPPTLPARP